LTYQIKNVKLTFLSTILAKNHAIQAYYQKIDLTEKNLP